MPTTGTIKPTHKAIQNYYAALQAYSEQQITHDGVVETAFQQLLGETAKSHGWSLVPKLSIKRGGKSLIPDGTVRDEFNLHRGYWEAKDNRSVLEWVIDQHQITEDKRSGIRSDPNRPDEPRYIVELVGQVIHVSVETVRIVKSLPKI